MGRQCILLLAIMLGVSSLALGATEDLAVVYNGQSTMPEKVVLRDWGFNSLQDPAKAYQPVQVGTKIYGLELLTLGRYQGARFDIEQSIDITKVTEKNSFFELYLRAPQGQPGATTVTTSPAPTDIVDPTFPAELTPPPVARIVPMPVLKNMRITFYTDKGHGVVSVPAADFYPIEEVNNHQWLKMDISMKQMKTLQPLVGNVQHIVITSDEPAKFLVGRVAFVRDADPIKVDPMTYPAFKEAGQRIAFVARINSGLARTETTWDFDTNAGVTIDATGDRATYIYDAEGEYTITCTTRDLSGEKEPVVKTIEVRVVRPQQAVEPTTMF